MIGVHHVVEGPEDRAAVVLTPSLGATLEIFDAQARTLAAAGYRAVRYDLRGHGRSPVPDGPSTMEELAGDLVGLLDRLGIASAHLVGVSIGGMVSLTVALDAPERVRSLVPSFTAAALGPRAAWDERIALVRERGTAALADAVVARWLTPAYAAAHPDVRERLRAGIAGTDDAGYASCCAAIAGYDVTGRLGEIAVPTLVVAGADDPSTPPALGAAVAAGIPGARLLVLDPCAHIGVIERAEAYDEALLAHLASVA